MSPARTGAAVAAAHALMLAVAWQSGLQPGNRGRDTTPLQVALLVSPSTPTHEPRPERPAPPTPRPPALPPLPAPPAPAVTPAGPPNTDTPAHTPEPAPPVAPPAEAAAPAPITEPALTLARADRQRCPPAPHPAALRERGIEGVVHLRVRVSAEGLPAEVNVTSGSGWLLMDQAALTQARGCRFVPARRGSEPVESWVEFPVRFVLNG